MHFSKLKISIYIRPMIWHESFETFCTLVVNVLEPFVLEGIKGFFFAVEYFTLA